MMNQIMNRKIIRWEQFIGANYRLARYIGALLVVSGMQFTYSAMAIQQEMPPTRVERGSEFQPLENFTGNSQSSLHGNASPRDSQASPQANPQTNFQGAGLNITSHELKKRSAAIGSGVAEIVFDSEPEASAFKRHPQLKLTSGQTTTVPRRSQQDCEIFDFRIAPPFRIGFGKPIVDPLCDPNTVYPEPIGFGMTYRESACCPPIYDPTRPANPWHLDRQYQEMVCNGGDKARRVMVDSSWQVYNLDVGDTIGHFDTLSGQRLVTASNPVCIYAPRFAAVRRVDGHINSLSRQRLGSMDERLMIEQAKQKDQSTTTKQNLAPERFHGMRRASGMLDTSRGVVADNVLLVRGARNVFEAYENLSLIRWGKHTNAETSRLEMGLQSANVWQDNLGLQVSVDGIQPVIVNDVYKVQQIVRIDSDDKQAILRVAKVASKLAAKAGEEIEFTIRFDNLSGRQIGNVTIIDSLTTRLEYVANSAECSLKSEFKYERNEAGSLILRWEIIDPMPANSGGIIRFKCRVR